MSDGNPQTNPPNPGIWQQLGAYITPQGLVGSLVFVIAFVGVGYLVDAVFKHLNAGWGLPVLALSGVLLLLGALLILPPHTPNRFVRHEERPRPARRIRSGSSRAGVARSIRDPGVFGSRRVASS
jgi:hypothetical protein